MARMPKEAHLKRDARTLLFISVARGRTRFRNVCLAFRAVLPWAMFLAICTSTIAFVETEWRDASATGYLPRTTPLLLSLRARGPPLDCRADGHAAHPPWMCRMTVYSPRPEPLGLHVRFPPANRYRQSHSPSISRPVTCCSQSCASGCRVEAASCPFSEGSTGRPALPLGPPDAEATDPTEHESPR